jgi:hypothetical protein
MSASPTSTSGSAGEPVNANGPLLVLDVGGDAVDPVARGSVVVDPDGSCTALVAMPIATVVDDPTPCVVCVDG